MATRAEADEAQRPKQAVDVQKYVETIKKLKRFAELTKKALEEQKTLTAQKDSIIERLRSTAKRGLEQTQKELRAKDELIERLRRDLEAKQSAQHVIADDDSLLRHFRRPNGSIRWPERVRRRVQDGHHTWCLVQIQPLAPDPASAGGTADGIAAKGGAGREGDGGDGAPGAATIDWGVDVSRLVWLLESDLEAALLDLQELRDEEFEQTQAAAAARGSGSGPEGGGPLPNGHPPPSPPPSLELELPEICLAPEDLRGMESQVAQLQARLREVEEEHRRFRVRTEVAMRQKDSELAQLRSQSVGTRVQAIALSAGGAGGAGHASDRPQADAPDAARVGRSLLSVTAEGVILGADGMPVRGKTELRDELRRLLDAEAMHREKLAASRDALAAADEQLMTVREECERLQQEAARWRKRAEEAETSQQARGSTLRARDAAADSDKYRRLRREYKQYRQRAMQVVEERDALIAALKEERRRLDRELEAARLGGGAVVGSGAGAAGEGGTSLDADVAAARSRSGSATSAGSGALPAASSHELGVGWDPALSSEVNSVPASDLHEYLKNVMLQYMTAESDDVRTRMEAAIAALLRFSPAECQMLQERRKQGARQGSWLPW